MTKLARVLGATLAAGAATLALTGGTAQATPNTVYLYTGTQALCDKIGTGGLSNGVFDSYECKSGVAGYSTLVDPSSLRPLNDQPVFTDAQAVCETVGTNGKNNGAWDDYYCQLGIVGWTLLIDRV